METILEKETTLTLEEEGGHLMVGKIAGYDNGSCEFDFDDNNGLYQMCYMFDSNAISSRDVADELYETLYNSLCRKYGDALGNKNGSCHLITGLATTLLAFSVYTIGETDGYDGDYVDYDEWVVDADDYHVKIDLNEFYWRDKNYNYYFYVCCSYKKFTDEDLEAARNEKQEEREEVDNDM